MQQLAIKFHANGSTQGWYLGQGHRAARWDFVLSYFCFEYVGFLFSFAVWEEAIRNSKNFLKLQRQFHY